MPIVTIIVFFVFMTLLLLLNNSLQNRKKLKSVKAYGTKTYDIELPQDAYIGRQTSGKKFPIFKHMSDAEGFFCLITPYLGSLSNDRRSFLFQSINDLKNELKIDKAIYQFFVAEYDKFDGLSDKDAATKWAGK